MSAVRASALQPSPKFERSPGPARRAMLLAFAFAVLWAVLENALGTSLSHQYDLMEVVWFRYATHLAVMLLLFARRGVWRLWRCDRPWLQISRSLLMLVMPASFALSLAAGAPVDLVWTVFWVTPLLIVGLARLILGEQVPWMLWACAALVTFAATIMFGTRMPGDISGLLFPFAMALSFSLYVVATNLLRAERLETNLFYTALGVFVVLTPWMLRVWEWPSMHDAFILAAIGVVGLLALAFLDRSVETCGVAIVAPVLGLHLPIGLAMMVIMFGGPFDRSDLIGTAVLVAVSALIWHRAATLVADTPTSEAGVAR